LHASTAERVSGLLELRVGVAGDVVAADAVTRRIVVWARAIEIGCFGASRVRVQSLQAQDDLVRAEWQCERLAASAIDGLARLLQHLAATQAKLDRVDLSLDGRAVVPHPEVALPDLPDALPFEVEYPEDLKSFVRVEIEFRAALTQAARDAVFDAFAVWDVLVAAFGDAERWGDQVDLETRLLNPRIVEHQVNGYFASFECLHPVVLLALRLHRRLAIDRLTLE